MWLIKKKKYKVKKNIVKKKDSLFRKEKKNSLYKCLHIKSGQNQKKKKKKSNPFLSFKSYRQTNLAKK